MKDDPPIVPAEASPHEGKAAAVTRDAPKIYQAGHTLKYTMRGLVIVFFWLLWGDFAFTFFEAIFARFMPLYLKDLHASNSLIGIMSGTIPGFVNIFFLPNISLWSDHYRGRLGRRIPFLYVVTPLTVVSLIAIGFAPDIAAWLAHLAPSFGAAAIILPLLCVFAVLFHFFNMVLCAGYNWLLRDVVPLELMARFLAWSRIVATLGSWAFLWFVFPCMVTRRREVFVGVGLFYLISFLLMCRNVKEGEYPPPPAAADRPGVFKSFGLYFKECFSVSLYRNIFLVFIFVTIGTFCANPFTLLFSRDSLHLSMDDMGRIFAWNAGISALVYFPVGWLCDKFSSVLVTLISLAGIALGYLAAYFWVHDKTSFLVYSLASPVAASAWGLGSVAMTMELFPEVKFGQFSGGLSVFSCGAIIFGNYFLGRFMDSIHSDYRMIFIWCAVSLAVSFLYMLLVYRGWKQHGGSHYYVAPLPRN